MVSTERGDGIITGQIGLEAQIAPAISFFASGGGSWRDNETSLQGEGGVRIRF